MLFVVSAAVIPYGVFKFGFPTGNKNSSTFVFAAKGNTDKGSTPAVFKVATGKVIPGPKPGKIPLPKAKLKDCGLPLAPCGPEVLNSPFARLVKKFIPLAINGTKNCLSPD